jgi:hypothetical protein
MITWLKQAWADLTQWFIAIFKSIVEFFTDLPVLVLEAFLDAIISILNSLPVPDFLDSGLGSFLNGISSDVLYFLSMSGFDNAVAILGTGFGFRMLRKLFTLGQW